MASYTQKTSTDDSVQIVLIGNSGSGKSCSGNTILNKKHFSSDASAKSVTLRYQIETEIINGRTFTVVDTQGWDCTERSLQEVEREIQQVLQTLNGPYSFLLVIRVGLVEVEDINNIYRLRNVQLVAPGPHAFLLVIDVRRFTEEEKNTVRNFQQIFGDGVHKHMIVLFTRGDDLEYDNKSIETFLQEAGPDLKHLISACGDRYHVFNNRKREDRTQVENLFQKIQKMLSGNNHSYYSYELFTMANDKAKLEAEVKRLQQSTSKSTSKSSRCSIL